MKSQIQTPAAARASTVSYLPPRKIRPINHSHLKSRQLSLLVRIDEERSLARAAAGAGLTQPAASKLLRKIECDFEVKLFDRHARGMTPTPYGEILIRHARRALSEFAVASDEIVALKSGLSGKAAIGTVLSPGTNLVPTAVLLMKERYPDVVVRIETGPSRMLVQKLVRGDLDMVIGRVLDSTPGEDLNYEELAADEPQAIIASARHPLAGQNGLQLEQLVQHPWIIPPAGSLMRERLTEVLTKNGLSLPSNIVEAESLPVISTLLRESHMLAILPEEALQPCCAAGILTVLSRNLPIGVGAFGLITRRRQKLAPAAQLLLSAVREQADVMYPGEADLKSRPSVSPIVDQSAALSSARVVVGPREVATKSHRSTLNVRGGTAAIPPRGNLPADDSRERG